MTMTSPHSAGPLIFGSHSSQVTGTEADGLIPRALLNKSRVMDTGIDGARAGGGTRHQTTEQGHLLPSRGPGNMKDSSQGPSDSLNSGI